MIFHLFRLMYLYTIYAQDAGCAIDHIAFIKQMLVDISVFGITAHHCRNSDVPAPSINVNGIL